MQGYHAPPSPPAVPDPVRRAAWDGYITLITTVLPVLRAGRESRAGEMDAAWRQLRAAVRATGSSDVERLFTALPQSPVPADLDALTAALAGMAGVRR